MKQKQLKDFKTEWEARKYFREKPFDKPKPQQSNQKPTGVRD